MDFLPIRPEAIIINGKIHNWDEFEREMAEDMKKQIKREKECPTMLMYKDTDIEELRKKDPDILIGSTYGVLKTKK